MLPVARAVSECFHSFSEVSQTFTGASIKQSYERDRYFYLNSRVFLSKNYPFSSNIYMRVGSGSGQEEGG